MIDRVTVVAWYPLYKGLQVEVFAEAHEAINFAVDKVGWPISPVVVSCPIQFPDSTEVKTWKTSWTDFLKS